MLFLVGVSVDNDREKRGVSAFWKWKSDFRRAIRIAFEVFIFDFQEFIRCLIKRIEFESCVHWSLRMENIAYWVASVGYNSPFAERSIQVISLTKWNERASGKKRPPKIKLKDTAYRTTDHNEVASIQNAMRKCNKNWNWQHKEKKPFMNGHFLVICRFNGLYSSLI